MTTSKEFKALMMRIVELEDTCIVGKVNAVEQQELVDSLFADVERWCLKCSDLEAQLAAQAGQLESALALAVGDSINVMDTQLYRGCNKARIDAEAHVGDLSALIMRLVRSLNKAAPAHDLPNVAMDYMRRNDLLGSPLRSELRDKDEETKAIHALFGVAPPAPANAIAIAIVQAVLDAAGAYLEKEAYFQWKRGETGQSIANCTKAYADDIRAIDPQSIIDGMSK